MLRNRFHSFINFGIIGTRSGRAKFADEVFNSLLGGAYLALSKKTDKDTENFSLACRDISAQKFVRDFVQGNDGVGGYNNGRFAEIITQDILDFVKETAEELLTEPSPHEQESELLDDARRMNKKEFTGLWSGLSEYLSSIYENDFDADFFTKKFNATLNTKSKKGDGGVKVVGEDKIEYDDVKNYFFEKWQNLLAAKTNEWKKEFIDYKKNVFIKRTEERIKNLKVIANTLQPGTEELGRLWNYTKGKWKKASYDVFAEYSEYFLKDITLQELARALGRSHEVEIEEEADLYSKQEIEYVWDFNESGKSELVGVHSSGDLAAILPSEIALLTDPDTDMLFYKRYNEKKLLSYEYIDKQFVKRETEGGGKRKKREAEGPFILCIDTSGSMRGGAEKIAKTIVFALLKFAFKTKRLCYLISFSTEIETLELSDLAASLPQLSEFLSMSFNGGSNAAPAFNEALAMLEKESYRKADVVVVSDFILPCLGSELSTRIQNAKERKTKFHSILVGTLADNAVNQTLIEDFDTNTVYDV